MVEAHALCMSKADNGKLKARPLITHMDEVETTDVSWLWYPYIAKDTLCMADGDPGVGKSLLMTQLAASLSRGYPLPDQQGGLSSGDLVHRRRAALPVRPAHPDVHAPLALT